MTGRRRVLWTLAFGALAVFWGAAAAVPGTLPEHAFGAVLCLSFAYAAWRAGARGELIADDD